MRAVSALIAMGALLGPGTAYAHHSLAMFDREKTVTINGTVKQFQWTNPHVEIEVVTDNADGMFIVWTIEGSAPTVLARDGWRPSSLRPGDKISLSVHPRKDGASGGYYADERPLLINGQLLAGKTAAQGEIARCD